MKMVKMLGFAAAVLVAFSVFADGNWQSQVNAATTNPAVIKQTMAGLSNADQLAFYKSVNEAINAKQASSSEKAKLFTDAANAALAAANKDNKTAMLAEVFATVPPEALTVVNENLAKGALAKGNVSDAEYAARARGTTQAISDRCAKEDNGSARTTFAIVAFARGSNGSPANLASDLATAKLGSDAAVANESWIPGAMKGDYSALLGATNAGEEPAAAAADDSDTPLLDAIIAQLDAETATGKKLPVNAFTTGIASAPGYGDVPGEIDVIPHDIDPTKARGYQGQN